MKGKIVSLSRTPIPQVRYVDEGEVKFIPVNNNQVEEAKERIDKVVSFTIPKCECEEGAGGCLPNNKYCEQALLKL